MPLAVLPHLPGTRLGAGHSAYLGLVASSTTGGRSERVGPRGERETVGMGGGRRREEAGSGEARGEPGRGPRKTSRGTNDKNKEETERGEKRHTEC